MLYSKLASASEDEALGHAAVLHFHQAVTVDPDLVTEDGGVTRIIRFDEISTLARTRAASLMSEFRLQMASRRVAVECR